MNSNHNWTDYHDAVIDHHAKLEEMPHVDTHSKKDAINWAHNIGEYFNHVSVGTLVASLAAIFVHHGYSKGQAKQMALEFSHCCNTVSNFANLITICWDSWVAHEPKQVNANIAAARVASNMWHDAHHKK